MMTSSAAATRSLFKNSVSQVGGRLVLSALRLVTAGLIVRFLGAERFGEYTVVIGFVLIFEWMVDFGQTDIVVRDISQRHEEDAPVEMGALMHLKAIQGVGLSLLLPMLVFGLGYSRTMIEAAAIGSLGLLCYAATLVFRATFKIRMRMERDILAEAAGALIILPLTWWAAHLGAGLVVLVGCYSISRLIYLCFAVFLARHDMVRPSTGGSVRKAAFALARAAAPLGLSGAIVWLYDALAPVLLSKIADMSAVALYAAPSRYIFAIIAVVQALNTAFFPMLARQWRNSREQFTRLQQVALETSMLMGIGFICTAVASATFLMRLIGPEVVEAAPVLQLMCAILLLRTVSTAMSPLIIISGSQSVSLWLTIGSIVLQVLFIAILVPRFGAFGAVVGYLLVEVFSVIPIAVIGQRASGVSLRWGPPALLTACGGAALLVFRFTPIWGSWLGGLTCPLLFLALCFLTGAVSLRKLRLIYAQLADRSFAAG